MLIPPLLSIMENNISGAFIWWVYFPLGWPQPNVPFGQVIGFYFLSIYTPFCWSMSVRIILHAFISYSSCQSMTDIFFQCLCCLWCLNIYTNICCLPCLLTFGIISTLSPFSIVSSSEFWYRYNPNTWALISSEKHGVRTKLVIRIV